MLEGLLLWTIFFLVAKSDIKHIESLKKKREQENLQARENEVLNNQHKDENRENLEKEYLRLRNKLVQKNKAQLRKRI